MNEVCGIVSSTPLKQPPGAINNNIVNFRASSATKDDGVDAFIKEQEKRRKQAEKDRKTNKILQWGTFLAFMTIAGVTIAQYRNPTRGIEQSKEELEKIWQDISKECTIADLALPESLQKFTKQVKKSFGKADIIKKRGGEPVKSVLLYGPPGTGKTSYAMAIAKEFPNSEFASIDMTKLDSAFRGVGDKNLDQAIETICKKADANPNKKYFVLLDEIDSIAMVDNSLGAADSNKTLNVFKRQFNNLQKRDNILVIGTTNLPITDVEQGLSIGGKKFDTALRDRFNAKTLVDYITPEQAINKTVRGYLDKELVSDELKNISNTKLQTLFKFFAKDNSRHSFRDLKNVINDAATSFESDTKKVELIDLVRAIKNRQKEYGFTNDEFNKLLNDLGISANKL